MINIRVITRVFGILLLFEGIMMLATALASYLIKDTSAFPLLLSGVITITSGVFIYTPLKDEEQIFTNREGYLIITGIWVIFSLFGTLPYLLSGTIRNFTDAFFESVSGFTTTGATILTDIESFPKGIIIWRSLSQWLGGLGIIFLSLYILPIFRDNPIQLSTTEFSGQSTDKIYPRWIDAAKRLILIYILLTLLEALILSITGMNVIDAFCISFSTLSTGGFSTHDNSLSFITNPVKKVVITIFMFAGGTNMTILYYLYKRDFFKIKENSEFVFYILFSAMFCVLVSILLIVKDHFSFSESIINGSFHIISVITTTGFYINDYSTWGNFILLIVFILMFTGGTVGSASGGIKIARIMIIIKNSRLEIKRLIHPDAFLAVRINHKTIQQGLVHNILVFVMIYFITVCASTLVLSLMNHDLITAFGTSAAILGNIGPGMGALGPFNNYSVLPVAGKWFLSFLMILGRLELLAVMVLFAKSFYRK